MKAQRSLESIVRGAKVAVAGGVFVFLAATGANDAFGIPLLEPTLTHSYEIYIVDSGGSMPPRKIANGQDPVWSPGSKKIAFTGSDWSVCVFDVDTGQIRTIIPGGREQDRYNTEPAWSPDGTRIAYLSERWISPEVEGYSPPDLWVANADGTEPTKIVDDVFNNEFCWMPDSKSLVYMSVKDKWVQMYKGLAKYVPRHLFWKRPKQLAEDETLIISPDVSPDGSFIAFVSQPNPQVRALSILDFNHNNRNIFFSEDVREPSISPDGEYIAVTRYQKTGKSGNKFDIVIVDRNGNIYKTIDTGFDEPWGASWSPDGNQLVFMASDGDMYIANIKTDSITPLVVTPASNERLPCWSPDGINILFTVIK